MSRALNNGIATVVRELDGKPGGIAAKRALASALESLSEEAKRDLEQAEKDTNAAIATAVEKVEKRFSMMFDRHEREITASVKSLLNDGLEKLTTAVKAKDSEQAESLIDKLRLALDDVKASGNDFDSGALAETLTKEIATAVKDAMPEPWKTVDATVTARDSSGKVKTIKLTRN